MENDNYLDFTKDMAELLKKHSGKILPEYAAMILSSCAGSFLEKVEPESQGEIMLICQSNLVMEWIKTKTTT